MSSLFIPLDHRFTNRVTESKKVTVTTILLASCTFGFENGILEQQMAAINFVRTLNNGMYLRGRLETLFAYSLPDPGGPFSSLIDDLIPGLVHLALSGSKTETRAVAMHAVDALWTNRCE